MLASRSVRLARAAHGVLRAACEAAPASPARLAATVKGASCHSEDSVDLHSHYDVSAAAAEASTEAAAKERLTRVVTVGVRVFHVDEIDLKADTFKASLRIYYEWQCDSLEAAEVGRRRGADPRACADERGR